MKEMKIGRNELKELIKECLVEVLEEGIANSVSALRESRSMRSTRVITQSEQSPSTLRPRLVDNIKSTISDPMLASLLADTAENTLLENVSSTAQSTDVGVPLGDEKMFARWTNSAFAEQKK